MAENRRCPECGAELSADAPMGLCGRCLLRLGLNSRLAAKGGATAGQGSPSPEAVTLDTAPMAEGPGTTIGRYKLLEQIGEGGMGVVFMAEQTEPVAARRPSAWYHLRKLAKRNKVLVGGMAAVVAALVLGIVGTSTGLLQARRAQGLAEQRQKESEASRRQEARQRDRAIEQERIASQERNAARRSLYHAHMLLARRDWADVLRLIGHAAGGRQREVIWETTVQGDVTC